MSIDWPIKRIEDVAKTSSGGTPERNNKGYFSGNILWIKSGELNDNYIDDSEEKITEDALNHSSAKIFPSGTVLVAMYGATVGKTAIIKKEASTNQAICGIIPNKNLIDNEFLRFQLMYKREDLLKQRYGGAQPNISQTILRCFELLLPAISEQRKIAYVLSTVQKAIEQQDKLIRTTTELKKALMQKLFTEGTKGEKQKQTEIGLVPESWEVISLGDCLQSTQYGLSVKGMDEGTIPILRMTNQKDGYISSENLQFINSDKSDKKKFILNYNDIIFNRTNSYELVGRTAIFKLEGDYTFASYLIRLKTDVTKMLPDYLNVYLNQDSTQLRLKTIATRGVSQSNISATRLAAFKVPLPSLSVQKEIILYHNRINEKINYHQKKNVLLSGLFKTLLHELMTGQRRVHEIDFEKLDLYKTDVAPLRLVAERSEEL